MTTQLGVDVLLGTQLNEVAGKRVGLVACPSSVDQQLRNTVELLYKHPDINLVSLFGPEHGLRGDAQAGSHIQTYIDPLTECPVHSLYGETRQPTSEMLQDLDAIIVDLQDGGVRFYTFLATTLNVMKAAKQVGCEVIILDRPAPINGVQIEGPMLDPAYASFVGPYPMPVRYGMTIGEIAGLVNDHYEINCDLTVIKMQGWLRRQWFDETGIPFIPSSPNLPTLTAMTVYPGTCLVEGTNISEGRGTTKPFEYIGAPWIKAELLADKLNELNLDGVRFRPVYFVPTFSKYQGELCAGVHVFVTDRNRVQPFIAALYILQFIRMTYPDKFEWRESWGFGEPNPIDLLCGGNTVRKHLDANSPIPKLVKAWQEELHAFSQLRAKYLLYLAS